MTDRKRIVIIEDEPDFLRIYTDLLLTKGFRVEGLADGKAGLDRVTESIPDCVLLDLVLPSMNGMEVLRRLRQNEVTKQIPVIIFSVMDNSQSIQQAMQLGANDYLVKGYAKPAEILAKIQAAINGQAETATAEVIELSIENENIEAVKIAEIIGLASGLNCDLCKIPLKLAMMTDNTRQNGHWFASHFKCPECHKEF